MYLFKIKIKKKDNRYIAKIDTGYAIISFSDTTLKKLWKHISNFIY